MANIEMVNGRAVTGTPGQSSEALGTDGLFQLLMGLQGQNPLDEPGVFDLPASEGITDLPSFDPEGRLTKGLFPELALSQTLNSDVPAGDFPGDHRFESIELNQVTVKEPALSTQTVLPGVDLPTLADSSQLQPKELKAAINALWPEVTVTQVETFEPSDLSVVTPVLLQDLEGKQEASDVGRRSDGDLLPARYSRVASSEQADSQSVPVSAQGSDQVTSISADVDFAMVSGSQSQTMPTTDGLNEGVSTVKQPVVTPKPLMTQVYAPMQDLIRQGGGKMTLVMDPPELGRLSIEVTTRGKQVDVLIRTENEATRSMLQGGMSDLKTALQSEDLQLSMAQVREMGSSSHTSMQFNGQSGFQRDGDRSQAFDGWTSVLPNEKYALNTSSRSMAPHRVMSAEGRVDVRV